jgi:hypothetical protein
MNNHHRIAVVAAMFVMASATVGTAYAADMPSPPRPNTYTKAHPSLTVVKVPPRPGCPRWPVRATLFNNCLALVGVGP